MTSAPRSASAATSRRCAVRRSDRSASTGPTLDELRATSRIVPIADAARATFPVRDLDDSRATDVRYGRSLDLELDGLTAVFAPDGEFLALYEPRDGVARAVAVFV